MVRVRSGCNEHNFASRVECYRCSAPREAGAYASSLPWLGARLSASELSISVFHHISISWAGTDVWRPARRRNVFSPQTELLSLVSPSICLSRFVQSGRVSLVHLVFRCFKFTKKSLVSLLYSLSRERKSARGVKDKRERKKSWLPLKHHESKIWVKTSGQMMMMNTSTSLDLTYIEIILVYIYLS